MQPFLYVRDYFGHFFIPGMHNAHRPRILHRPWLIFFLAIILATEGFLVSNLIARQSDQQFLAAVVPAEIISLTNTERKDNSVSTLKEDALLDKAAQAKANDMASKGYFAHVDPSGKTPWQWISASGYQYQYAGENLAVRFINSSDVVNAWMASPTHRANMVKPVYTQIGVGVAEGMYNGQPASYVVQYFGTPKVTAATQPAAVAAAVDATTQSNSFTQSVTRQLVRAFSEPQQSSNFLLGFIAVLLMGALMMTFFTHLQIQHTSMLATGAFVVALALFFLVANAHLVGGATGGTQSASVASYQGGVIIDSAAADTGYALFPN